jgi:hypothetical protein
VLRSKSDTTFLDKDVKRALKPQLSEAQSRLVAKFHGLQDELYASEENKDQTAFKITDKREAITSLEERTARAESTLGTEKELWGEKNRAATEEVDTLDARIHRLKTADESSLADSQRALEDLHTQYTETSQRFVAEKVLMNDSLLTMCALDDCLLSERAHAEPQILTRRSMTEKFNVPTNSLLPLAAGPRSLRTTANTTKPASTHFRKRPMGS